MNKLSFILALFLIILLILVINKAIMNYLKQKQINQILDFMEKKSLQKNNLINLDNCLKILKEKEKE